MTYSLSERFSYIGPRMAGIDGDTVTYHRGGSSVSLTAVPQEMSPDELAAYGMPVDETVRVFVIDSADLEIDGCVTLPRPGDWIKHDSIKCKVAPVGEGQPSYRHTTHTRDRLMIYTKVIG